MFKSIGGRIKAITNNDYLFSIIAKIAGLFISIVLGSMTARFFGPELKGVSSVIENDVSLYSVFLGLGIYQAYPFFKKKEPGLFPCYVNNISTMFLGLEVIAVSVATVMFLQNASTYLAVAIILMPVAVYTKQLNYVVLIEAPRRRSMSSMIISLSEVALMLVFIIFLRPNVGTIVAYVCIGHGVSLVLSFINLRVNPLKIRFDLSRIWTFAKFGVIPMLVYLCMTVNYKIDIQMLKRMGTVSYADIGIYGTAVGLASKIWLIPDAVKDILLSKLVKGGTAHEVARVIRINLFVCVIATILMVVFGRFAILLLFGEEYESAYTIMIVLFVGILGMIFYKMVYSYNISMGRRTINLIFLGGAAVINFVGNLFLIPPMGVWGAALMSVVSYCVCGISFLVYFRVESKIPLKEIVMIQKSDVQLVKKFFSKK